MTIDKLYSTDGEFIDYQRVFGSSEHSVTSMNFYEEDEKVYSMNNLQIGYLKDGGGLFSLSLNRSKRILIIGSSGSGKTVLSNTIIDRFIKAGGAASVFDVKGEYVQKYKPLPKEYAEKTTMVDGVETPQFLLPGEQAQGFPLQSYYPIFLNNLYKSSTGKDKKLHDNEKFCQIGMGELTKADFLTFFDTLTKDYARYFDILDELWTTIEKNDLYSWEEIIDAVGEMESLAGMSSKVIIRSIGILKENEILGDMYDDPDLVGCIQNGKIGILNLQGLLDLPSAVSPALVYVNIMLRRIYNSKVRGIVNKKVHNLIHVDEINKLIPREGDTPSKREFLKMLDLVRSEHISMMYSTQDWKRIPITLIEQADYIFIPYNTTLENLVEIIKSVLPNEYSVPQTFKSKMAYIQGTMHKYRDGKRDWIVVDRGNKIRTFIVPMLPLSYFVREGEDT